MYHISDITGDLELAVSIMRKTEGQLDQRNDISVVYDVHIRVAMSVGYS